MTLLCRIQHSENKQKYILFWAFALLFFCIAVSTPILQAGFFGDDIWDSTMKGRMLLNQQGMWETVGVNIKTWLAEGRFFPLNVLSTTALFYFAPHAEMYQIIRVILIWLSLLSFAYLASIIANNRNVGLLFLFCVPLSWSIRISTEPLTTYAFFMPLLTFFIAATLGSYIQFQKTAKQAWLDAAFFMYLCALTTYELGVITFLLLIILAIQKPVGKKCLWPFFIVTLMYVLMNFKLQLVSTAIYPGVEIGALTKFWSAFVAQLSATFPLSYCLSLQHVKLSEVVSKYFVQPAHVAFITSLFLISLSCIFVLLKKIILPKNARLCFFLSRLRINSFTRCVNWDQS